MAAPPKTQYDILNPLLGDPVHKTSKVANGRNIHVQFGDGGKSSALGVRRRVPCFLQEIRLFGLIVAIQPGLESAAHLCVDLHSRPRGKFFKILPRTLNGVCGHSTHRPQEHRGVRSVGLVGRGRKILILIVIAPRGSGQ